MPNRFKRAWSAFLNKDPTYTEQEYAREYISSNPDRVRLNFGSYRSMINTIINRIAMDVSATNIEHVTVDENGRFLKTLDSQLNYCLTTEANIDQTSRRFLQDVVMTMMEEGVVAIVPTDTTVNPIFSDSYDVKTMRVGTITEWFTQDVRVRLYNEKTGMREEKILPKKIVAIIQNPFYSIMNEPNSTWQRLSRKIALLDKADEKTASGKLDMIIQLPYVIKTEARRQQAEERRKDLEAQLSNSQYGIAYTDHNEQIVQLNRSLENNLQSQIEYLTRMLYSQLGMTSEILDGTANESTMLNYHNRIVEPVVSAIVDEMKRTFISKTARTRGQSIYYYRDPFRLVPISELTKTADVFERNEIMTSNEFRQIIGLKPSEEPKADMLQNSNLYQPGVTPDGQPIQPESPEDMLEQLKDTPINQLQEEGE